MNEEEFKKCMSYFTTGITIVTTAITNSTNNINNTAINNNSTIIVDKNRNDNTDYINNNISDPDNIIITEPVDNKIFPLLKAGAEEKESLFGITVNSFNSVSLNPPMILYSLEKNTARFNIFYQAKKFFINILGQEQKIISSTFSYNNFEAWQKYFLSTAKPAGRIENAICSLYCETKYRYEGGDHIIIVADVKESYLNNKSYNKRDSDNNSNSEPETSSKNISNITEDGENISSASNYRKPDIIVPAPDSLAPLVYYQGRYHKIGEKL